MTQPLARRRTWHALSAEERRRRLEEMRRRQQTQIEVELRYLRRR